MFKHAFEVAHHNIAKMTGKKSPIWIFFCVINNAQAKWNFCGAIASTKSGSTGNLRRHVKAKHPSISLTKDSVAVVAVVDSDEWSAISKICEILDVFDEVTQELSAEKVV